MAATTRISYFNGGSDTAGAGVTAEGGCKFNRDNTLTGTTPVPKPTATGTNYSWPKFFGLEVTATDSTSISNRKVHHESALATGLELFFKGTATYNTPDGADISDNGTTNGADPATYTAMTTSAQTYDADSVSAGSAGLNGDYCVMALGVSNNYAGGAGSAVSLGNIILTYDEA